ncbi:DnaJ protein P58IPK [Tanacetum coccineum]
MEKDCVAFLAHVVDKDTKVKRIQDIPVVRNNREKFKVWYHGVIYLKGRAWIPKVGNLREIILDEAHRSRYLIHPGADKMYQDIKEYYSWPRIKKDIALYVGKCLTCAKVKDALNSCISVLTIDKEHVEALIESGEAKLLIEDWEGTVADMKASAEKSPQDMSVREGLMMAYKALKLSQRKDWYKILGISKSASIADKLAELIDESLAMLDLPKSFMINVRGFLHVTFASSVPMIFNMMRQKKFSDTEKASQKAMGGRSTQISDRKSVAKRYGRKENFLHPTIIKAVCVVLICIGSVDTPSIALSGVYYMPSLTMNLDPISKICDSGCDVKFFVSYCFIYDRKTQKVAGTGHKQENLYVLDHFRALGKQDARDISDCSGCKLAKFSALPFSNSFSSSNAPFDLVHSDVWGPSPVSTKGGSR